MLAALALQLASLVSLAVAMPRHGRHMLGRLPGRREERIAGALGWSGLALSLLFAGRRGDPLALMVWIGAIPLCAGTVTLLVAYRPRWPMRLGVAAAIVAGIALL